MNTGMKMENGLFSETGVEAVSEYVFDSPVGPLTLECTAHAVTALRFGKFTRVKASPMPISQRAERELAEYFGGRRHVFDLPLAPSGTPFQLAVWRALCDIPYGQTRSYKEIAQAVGNPKACRAVGMANNRNPIPILIPCHRVVGADGTLVGYGGGLWIKRRLLSLENVPVK